MKPRNQGRGAGTGKFVTIAGKRVPTRHATKEEGTRAARYVLSQYAAAIANLKNR